MVWAFQDAKAHLSEVARRTVDEGPQHVTVRGRPALVVMSQKEYDALVRRKRRRPLVELYRKSPIAGKPLDAERSRDVGRTVKL